MNIPAANIRAPWWRRLLAAVTPKRAVEVRCDRCGLVVLDSPSPKVETVRCSGTFNLGDRDAPVIVCLRLRKVSS